MALFGRNNDDDDEDSLTGAAFDAAFDAMPGDRQDDYLTRDSVSMRWMKFLVIIGFLAMVGGGVAGFSGYFAGNDSYHRRSIPLQDRMKDDTAVKMRRRIIIGAGIGGGVGLLYVIRCLIKRVDP
jgi:hypothetical protein